MKKIVLPIGMFATTMLFVLSCSKKSSSSTPCKLITVTETNSSSTTTTNIAYNNEGKITTENATTVNGGNNSTNNTVFTYAGNVILKTTTYTYNSNPPETWTDSLATNSAGYVIAETQRYSPTSYTYTTYTYDGSNKLLKSTSQSGSNPPSTSIVSYSGGDMNTIVNGTDTTYLYYNTGKASSRNDYLYLLQQLQYSGAHVFNCAHQLTALTNPGSPIMDLDYTLDDKGNLVTMKVIQGSSIDTYSMQYDCTQ